MIFGATGMSLSMVALAVSDSIGTSKAGIATTVFLFVFNTFFASKSRMVASKLLLTTN